MEKKTTFDPGAYLPSNDNGGTPAGTAANGTAAHAEAARHAATDCQYASGDDTTARVRQVAEAIAARGVDITQGYHNWLRLAMALADGLGEEGRPLFHSLSAMNAQYAAAECDRQYDNCLKSHRGGITIATFFQMARDTAGIDLAEMARENVKNGAKCAKCASTPVRHGNSSETANTLQNNHNYLNNNKLYKNTNNNTHVDSSPWRSGALGALGALASEFPTGYTFSDKLQAEDLPPLLARIIGLHADVVSRDKMATGA